MVCKIGRERGRNWQSEDKGSNEMNEKGTFKKGGTEGAENSILTDAVF